MRRVVAVNEHGQRIGEDHPGAKLTDHEVELMIEMHEDKVGYRKLAKIFEISRSQVRNICKGIKRSQTPHDWKTVHLLE